jgi:hypothetical protein
MKKSLLKLALILGLVTCTSYFAQAQKFGDNLGNHTATKDLLMSGKMIKNAAGLAIGVAEVTNNNVALQIDGADKAILIPRVTNILPETIAAPLNGMIVYSLADNTFYLYQNGAWVTFALGLNATGAGIEMTANDNGYTLTQVGQQTVLKLAAADATHPGIVTAVAQTLGGDKTFAGNVIVDAASTLTVGTGATTLGGTLTTTGAATLNSTVTAAGDLTVGTTTTAANTALNGNLTVTGATVLAGAQGAAGSETSAIKMTNVVAAAAADEQSFVVLDADGNVKKGSFNGKSLAKYQVPVPAGSSATFDPEGNSGIDITLTIPGIVADDAIVVNFSNADRAKFAGLTILSATATGVNTVVVTIADFRNPAVAGYARPDIDAANLIVTKYNAANTPLVP